MLKKSKQREAIKKVLNNTRSHPSAEWIYEEVKKEIPNIGLATVYRNLKVLKAAGEIMEIPTAKDTARYDGCTATHYHFSCERCGGVIDIDEPVDNSIVAAVAKRTGLLVTNHSLMLTGLCWKCQGKRSPENQHPVM
jgi:Fur family transcriptional regulator, peroxide stress response regulator